MSFRHYKAASLFQYSHLSSDGLGSNTHRCLNVLVGSRSKRNGSLGGLVRLSMMSECVFGNFKMRMDQSNITLSKTSQDEVDFKRARVDRAMELVKSVDELAPKFGPDCQDKSVDVDDLRSLFSHASTLRAVLNTQAAESTYGFTKVGDAQYLMPCVSPFGLDNQIEQFEATIKNIRDAIDPSEPSMQSVRYERPDMPMTSTPIPSDFPPSFEQFFQKDGPETKTVVDHFTALFPIVKRMSSVAYSLVKSELELTEVLHTPSQTTDAQTIKTALVNLKKAYVALVDRETMQPRHELVEDNILGWASMTPAERAAGLRGDDNPVEPGHGSVDLGFLVLDRHQGDTNSGSAAEEFDLLITEFEDFLQIGSASSSAPQ